MNKKGFTLIEILTTILILSFIIGIAAITYSSIVKNVELKSFKTYEETMYAEAMGVMFKALSEPDKAYLYLTLGHPTTLYLSDLGIDDFRNPRNSSDLCPSSYVIVTKQEGGSLDSLTYNVCLKCFNSDYDNCRTFPE